MGPTSGSPGISGQCLALTEARKVLANWRRAWWPGGTWFFTVNLLERRSNRLLVEQIDLLRHSVAKVQQTHPFVIHAWVVLPNHLHHASSLFAGRGHRLPPALAADQKPLLPRLAE